MDVIEVTHQVGARSGFTHGDFVKSPSGKTREYGFNLSFLNDRLSLRYNRYTTSVVGQSFNPPFNYTNAIVQMTGFWISENNANRNPTIDRKPEIEKIFAALPANFRSLSSGPVVPVFASMARSPFATIARPPSVATQGAGVVREMGVVMTAIIMSGRTGAAFAAHLGSMKANEEIDALQTFGFNPFDFLVLPRMLALIVMMPLLTIYANAVGILGGMLVGATVGIPPILYWNETLVAVNLTNASLGIFKNTRP